MELSREKSFKLLSFKAGFSAESLEININGYKKPPVE